MNSDGHEVKLDSKAILIGNNLGFLFSCEFHYYIIPQKNWDNELINIKKIGFNAITVYIPWNYHENNEGEFDFKSSNYNLKKLFNLCIKYNIYIYIKSGPRSSSEIKNSGYPDWLLENYPEIIDLDSSGNLLATTQKLPIISYLHPIFLEKVQRWYQKIFSLIEKYQYPKGNIILIQIEDELGYNFIAQYFSFGYSKNYQESYQKWLKNKYLLIPVLNGVYSSHYIDFTEIYPPQPPKQLNYSKKDIIPYLEWLEFKETILAQYVDTLFEFMDRYEIKLPLILNLLSYKSPISVFKLLNNENIKNRSLPINISLNFDPIVFKAQVNVNCYVNWHSEWLKIKSNGPPFIAKIQESSFDEKIVAQNIQILLRLMLAHGIRAMSINLPLKSQDLSSVRYKEIKIFKDFLDLHSKSLIQSKKINDPISLAYYHPVTRLKSFHQPISSQSFSFPINYDHLKFHYKNLLQLLTKFFLHYDVVDLQRTPNDILCNKPFIMFYYLGWMEHDVMVKLRDYVKGGGVLITFGDIPLLNEFLEDDNTISDMYGAKCIGEIEKPGECTWSRSSSEISDISSSINILFEYKLNNKKKVSILAHEGNFKHTYAFSRSFYSGKIIHCGIMPKPEIESLELLNFLFEEISFPTKNISASSECVVIQNVSNSEERFFTVGNLQSTPKKSVSFTFYNPKGKIYPKEIKIDDVTLPPHTFSIWHAGKKIGNDVFIEYCTGEIFEILEREGKITTSIRFFAHPAFPKAASIKISLWIPLNSTPFKVENGLVKFSIKDKNERNNKEITIQCYNNATFSFEIGEMKYVFVLEKYFVPGDEM